MNPRVISNFGLCVLFAVLAACGSPDATPAKPVQLDAPHLGLIPAPSHSVGAVGTFRVAATTDIVYSGGEGAAGVAQYFVELIKQQRPDLAFRKPKEDSPQSGSIAFVLNADEKSGSTEGYALSVSPKGVTITARAPEGLFYGAVTLWQLITAEAMQGLSVDVPALRITDSPRFAWRGVMLDSARHFQSPEYVKQFIDWMALHKLNVLHWH
ncbi:MAG: glycoside hydrolase family 20 zincin-like fold domain-containing protein, partial [Peristeroidobacter soli]